MVMHMNKENVVTLKKNIEDLREEINRYIEYPDIFKEEILVTSRKIDELINEYLKINNGTSMNKYK